jgi:hypothetical protein
MKIKDYEYYLLSSFFNGLADITEAFLKWFFAKNHWHRWWAWRPVRIAETRHDNIVVPAHYVWLDYVDTKRAFICWYRYRSNTLDKDIYAVPEWKNGEQVYALKPYNQLRIYYEDNGW